MSANNMRSSLPFDTSQSACKEHHVQVFYPIIENPQMSTKMRTLIQQAKQICGGCSVKEPCLDYALHNESYGIWGGMSETERQYARMEKGIQYQPWQTGYGHEIESTNAKRARKRWNDRERKRKQRQAFDERKQEAERHLEEAKNRSNTK